MTTYLLRCRDLSGRKTECRGITLPLDEKVGMLGYTSSRRFRGRQRTPAKTTLRAWFQSCASLLTASSPFSSKTVAVFGFWDGSVPSESYLRTRGWVRARCIVNYPSLIGWKESEVSRHGWIRTGSFAHLLVKRKSRVQNPNPNPNLERKPRYA